MLSAILSLGFGFLSWLGVPALVPAIGLALGLNAIIRERQLPARKPLQRYLGVIGTAVNGLAITFILLSLYA